MSNQQWDSASWLRSWISTLGAGGELHRNVSRSHAGLSAELLVPSCTKMISGKVQEKGYLGVGNLEWAVEEGAIGVSCGLEIS